MKLISELLLYLDKKTYLMLMKNSCEKYLEELTESVISKFPSFRFILEIDVLDLLNLHPDLGNWLLKEPLQFQRACSEILYACLQSLNNDNKAVEFAQVITNLRLKCVPQLEFRWKSRSYTGLTSIYGLLVSVSKPESYVNYTVWSCPEECEGNEIIRHYIPEVPPKCCVCKSVQFENSGLRHCGERVIAKFKLKKCLLPATFTIVDDLISKLNVGGHYIIYLTAVKNSAIVWDLEQSFSLRAPLTSPVPTDVKEIFNACNGIPWQFIYCLASSIGIEVSPLHSFMHLKISLLLSLASLKANIQTGSTIIHVLAAGYDTGCVGRLMEKGAELADSAVFLGTTHTVASTAVLGSSGGVCAMPLPLHIYNQKATSAILSFIETGEVATEMGKVKLRSAIWAQGMDFNKTNLVNVASVFGNVCRGDYGEYNEETLEFLLQNTVEPTETSKEEREALKDVRLYLDLVGGINVSVGVCAEKLLRKYFLAARRESPRRVPVSSMGWLVASCMTSARLCQRATAGADDAVFAIWLHACGALEPRCAPEEYLQTPTDVQTLQNMMDKFKHWLEQFIGSYIL
ncbi:uncharacterized protein LOC126373114 [Pectinophora gossypiella]|uniref:uncharacterized protein LOC126373114 n=1 Tax=Pectinophora gossypiella TaxID=13191 RepID=UPI00214E7581|nr:uncharacterized protein LOC126373114 [Pectinophora gossypiella]